MCVCVCVCVRARVCVCVAVESVSCCVPAGSHRGVHSSVHSSCGSQWTEVSGDHLPPLPFPLPLPLLDSAPFCRDLCVVANSLQAYASVNHLHCHALYLRQEITVQKLVRTTPIICEVADLYWDHVTATRRVQRGLLVAAFNSCIGQCRDSCLLTPPSPSTSLPGECVAIATTCQVSV